MDIEVETTLENFLHYAETSGWSIEQEGDKYAINGRGVDFFVKELNDEALRVWSEKDLAEGLQIELEDAFLN